MSKLPLTALVLGALSVGSLPAEPARAESALTPYYGRYETEVENCTKPLTERVRGSYALVGHPFENGEAMIRTGDYEAEGGGCEVQQIFTGEREFLMPSLCSEEDYGGTQAFLKITVARDERTIDLYEARDGEEWSQELHRCSVQSGYSVALYDADEAERLGLLIEDPPTIVAQADEPMLNGGNWVRDHICTYSKNGRVLSEATCRRDGLINPVTWTWSNGNVAVVEENDDAQFSPVPLPARWNGQPAMHSADLDYDCFLIERTGEEFCVRG